MALVVGRDAVAEVDDWLILFDVQLQLAVDAQGIEANEHEESAREDDQVQS